MSQLLEKLQKLPNSTGVYHYYDSNGKLLYIGKAKNLKNRVRSYFRFTPTLQPANNLSPRIESLISQTVDISWIVVENEHDALILENSLIKQLKPKYNILLRDDKTYPYIYINLSEPFPRFEVTRKVIKNKNIKYFGPYSMSASTIVETLYEKFPLVQKKSCIKGQKACLYYQIKKCLAPCEGKIDIKQYAKIVQDAIDFLSNKSKIIEFLKQKMDYHSLKLEFEKASTYKTKYEKIEKSMILSSVDIAKFESFDIIAIAIKEHKACIVRMFIREGKLTSSSSHISKSTQTIDKQEIYSRAILDFYTPQMPMLVNKIYIYDDIDDKTLLSSVLKERFGKKIEIIHPKKAEKRKICSLAYENSHEILRISKKDDNKIVEKIKELCNLSNIPYVIEIFDNSHLQGEATVASMVVYKDNKFAKQNYKHYNLNSHDEYGQMREVLKRRIDSFKTEPPPDLWILDGGVAQLNLANELLQSCATNLDVIAISKEKIDAKAHRLRGGANDIIHTQNETIKLDKSDKRLHFIQLLRDEAHRFAISFHRKQKAKKDKQISLLNTKGVGEAKLKKLLNYFETFKNIKNATLDELCVVIDEKTAKNIKDYYAKLDNL